MKFVNKALGFVIAISLLPIIISATGAIADLPPMVQTLLDLAPVVFTAASLGLLISMIRTRD